MGKMDEHKHGLILEIDKIIHVLFFIMSFEERKTKNNL